MAKFHHENIFRDREAGYTKMDIPPATTEKIPGDPLIVHISDIHGYLTDAQSALGAVGDAEQYPDLVTTDESDQLHWADNDYTHRQ
ncbi:hypothetical protein Z052_07615, partial [Halorubrum sp. C191]